MCIGERVHPTTPKSQCFTKVLLFLIIPQIAVTVLAFIGNEYFLKEAIISIFFLLILFIGYYKLSYQAMMIYVFMALFFFITFLVYIMTGVQNGRGIGDQLLFSIAVVNCAYYLFVAIFSFFPYREFKAIQYAQNPALAEYVEQNMRLNSNKPQQKKENDNIRSDEKLAVQMKDDFPPPQYYQPKAQAKKSSSSEGYFTGRGVKIG